LVLPELPDSPEPFINAGWTDVLPYYEALARAPLSRENAESWLASWSRLSELLGEAGTVAMIEYTGNTADPALEERYLRFSAEIYPRAEEQEVRLASRLLDLDFERPDLGDVLRGFRTDAAIFREENVALFSELEELAAAYQKITGGLLVDWNGEKKTVPQLQPMLKSPDRAVRERAFRLGAGAYQGERAQLADLFDRMFALRQRVAQNSGFANYQEYIFHAKHRFHYSAEDCQRFHRAVETAIVPRVERLLEYRRRRLGVTTVRPWDVTADPENAEPLHPFSDVAEFVAGAERVFRAVDAQLGDWFSLMAREGLLDLENRQNKAPGGYCTKLSHRKVPFIFMNAVGVADDVNTLVHEAGHCFHAFASADHPFIWQRGTGSEAAELASMSMELLAAPHLAKPTGYYELADVQRAWIEHLEDVLMTLPHVASVDAFQSWLYTSGQGHDRDARDQAWLDIRNRFESGIDWSGLEEERVARWYRQLHIFEYPFYYIEYGIAQIGALQIWRRSHTDPEGAVAAYKSALALGGTRSLPDIYRAAGADLIFDAHPMAELAELVASEIDRLRAPAGAI
jgi:oligoendopeptidase F